MDNLDTLIAQQELLYTEMYAAAKALRVYYGHRSPIGLTPDSIKALPEWKAAKAAYEQAFQKLRAFNGKHAKAIRKAQRA